MATFVLDELLYVREKARQGAEQAEAVRTMAVAALRDGDSVVHRAEWLRQFDAAWNAHLAYLRLFHDTLSDEEPY